ncbi:MAG: metallophosphoesterase family protein [Planctomycetota bacterium]|nr:metallophosphoesterase family protein [Planctomycetota bacterium]
MIAIISDIHSNLEALQAVLDDIDARGVERIFCLGDLVGYGPDPLEVMSYAHRFEFCIRGNHDEAVIGETPDNFNPIAKNATNWTREQLNPAMHKNPFKLALLKKKKKAWEYLTEKMELKHAIGDSLFLHDTPVEPGSSKYFYSLDQLNTAFKKNSGFTRFFIGHSHLARIYTEDDIIEPEPGKEYPLRGRQVINVGSVGQPRDGDPRPSYAIVNESIRFYRLRYDIDTTVEKILRTPALDNFLARRLLFGK